MSAKTAKTRKSAAPEAKKLRVTQVKSTIGFDRKQELAMQGLGLRKIGHSVERQDTPSVRGLILVVRHLVKVEGA